MIAMWIALGIWAAGFVAVTAVTFLTGGEHHVRPGDWWIIWVGLLTWPVWVVVVLYKIAEDKIRHYGE